MRILSVIALLALTFTASPAAAAVRPPPNKDTCNIKVEPHTFTARNGVQSVILTRGKDGLCKGVLALHDSVTVTEAFTVDCPPEVWCALRGPKKTVSSPFSNETPLKEKFEEARFISCSSCSAEEKVTMGPEGEGTIFLVVTFEGGETPAPHKLVVPRKGNAWIKFHNVHNIERVAIRGGPDTVACWVETALRKKTSDLITKRKPLNTPFPEAVLIDCWQILRGV